MNKQPEVRARTRKKLMDAFWTLSKNKSISQISVGELAHLAGYNRSTFYEYFTDMPDLIRQAEDELLEYLREEITEWDLMQGDTDQEFNVLYLIFHLLNEPVYCLLGPNGDPSFFSRVKELLLPLITDQFELRQDSPYFGYMSAFVYSAFVGYLQYWNEQDKAMPEEEFFRLGYELMMHGVMGVLIQERRTEC